MASKTRVKGTTSDDVEVGQRIRARRMAKGMSQTELGDLLGVTFQQVQKYEKGTNRTSAGRLAQIASILGTGLMPLFEGVEVSEKGADETLGTLLGDHKAIELLRAFALLHARDAEVHQLH